jgi:hypothetical protein
VRHDNRRAGILAARQHAVSRDHRVLEVFVGYVAVVVRRLLVIENVAKLLQMAGAEKELDV